MNKKVYYHNKHILLSSGPIQQTGNQLIVDTGKLGPEGLGSHIKKFIQQNDGPDLVFLAKDVNNLFNELKKHFSYIEAAGGLIEQNNKYLFIYRLGKWDLPKGKIDAGESPEQAALRECEEECGISELEIARELPSTYHIYPYKNSYALKTTYWFHMRSSFTGQLIPQTDENIEKAEWLDGADIKNKVLQNTYLSVADVIFFSLGI